MKCSLSRSTVAITSPPRITMTRSDIPRISGISEGDHDNALALLYQAVHYVVNLDLCADVDTTGRLVEDKDVCVRVDPLADNNLLLVAAGQLTDDLVDRRGS